MKTEATKENIRVGAYLVTTAGYTMRHAAFYRIKEIKGTKVVLECAAIKTHSDRYGQEGQIELIGEIPGAIPGEKNAKFTAHGLKLCERGMKVGNYWGTLKLAAIGDKESFYGD